MKNLLIVFVLFTFTSACSNTKTEETKPAQEAPKTTTLVFIDKTQSVNVNNDFVRNKYFGVLNNLVNENINGAGDKIELYYIHENTAKAKVLTLVSKTIKENLEGLNATDLEAANTNYEISIKKERKMMLTILSEKMMEQNSGASNNETNITVSVPLISRVNDAKTKVYYFSDMVESVKSGRDFHKMAPISVSQADEWATSDADKMKNETLHNAQIFIVLPFDPMSSSKENNPNVSDYWKKYFDILQAKSVEEI